MKAIQGTGILRCGDGKHDQEVQSTPHKDKVLRCGGDEQEIYYGGHSGSWNTTIV